MNKKIFGLIAGAGLLIVIGAIFWMFSSSSKKEETKNVEAPTMAMGTEANVNDVANSQSQNNQYQASDANTNEQPSKEVVSEEDIRNAILPPTPPTEKPNPSTSSSNTPIQNNSNNNKYQYTDLYEDPTTREKPKPQPKTEYTEDPQSQTVSVPKKKAKKQYWDVKLRSEQKAFTGGTLSFILMQDAKNQDGDVIPKGTVMSGIANIQNNRIYVRFTSVSINYEIFPLNFTLCNTQGMEGLGIIQKEDNNSSTRSNAGSVVSGALSSVPIIGGIVGGAVNDATNRTKKESYKIPSSYRAKITTFDTQEIY